MGNFGLVVTQNYAVLYLRIGTKDFLQILQHDRRQWVDKNNSSEISQKFLF